MASLSSSSSSSSSPGAAALVSFFVFNPTLARSEENEHRKICFYSPSTTSLDEQQREIGLSQGFINFASTFSNEHDCDVVHCVKHRYAFRQCEKDYWMVLVVRNPSTVSKGSKEKESTITYIPGELDDTALQAAVTHAYETFRLFHGRFEEIFQRDGIEGLRKQLSLFFEPSLGSMGLESLDFFEAMNGVRFLPVDKRIYLAIQHFVNLAESAFASTLLSTFLLYEDQLVWSGLIQSDTVIFYRFLVRYMLGEDAMARKRTFSPPLAFVNRQTNGFLTDPTDLREGAPAKNTPIFLNGDMCDRHTLVVYRRGRILMAFIVNPETVLDVPFHQNFDSFLSTEAPRLEGMIHDQYSRIQQGPEEAYRYVYLNHMNLALNTSIRPKNPVSKTILQILGEVHREFEASPESVREICIRTHNDGWVFARRSEGRELFIVLDQRHSALITVEDEVNRLVSSFFSNILLT